MTRSAPKDELEISDVGAFVDLDGIDFRARPPAFANRTPERCVAIVPGTQAVPPSWLGLLRHPNVSLIVVPGSHPTVHPHAAVALREFECSEYWRGTVELPVQWKEWGNGGR